MKRYQYALWLTSVVILVGMTACSPRATELPLETIERNDSYSAEEGYGGLEPRVVLITSQDDIDRLDGLISQVAIDQLAELNFEQYFAVAVLRGRQPTSGYNTIIKRVAKQGDKIIIYAQFWEPSPYYEVTLEETSPYHLIRVRWDNDVSKEIELMLQSQLVTPTPPSR